MLSIHNLAFLGYGPFSFSVKESESISIHGHSGSGKTLLLRAIADLDQHLGEVKLNNKTQDSMPAPHWRKKIGYLPADAIFWADTFAQHMQLEDTAFLQEVQQTLQIAPLIHLPINQLSSGEKQRLALFRLLMNEPDALLLDEPTSHLDLDSTLAVETVISRYQQMNKCPLILVSHNKKQCTRMASRHFTIKDKSLQTTTL